MGHMTIGLIAKELGIPENGRDRTPTDSLRAELTHQVYITRDSLVHCLISLGNDLLRIGNNLKDVKLPEDGECYYVNSLGEIQGRGNDIDRKCGELSIMLAWRTEIADTFKKSE